MNNVRHKLITNHSSLITYHSSLIKYQQMNYVELKCEIKPYDQKIAEMLIAEMSYHKFESFVEDDPYLYAYIQEDDWYNAILLSMRLVSNLDHEVIYSHRRIEEEDWNKTWEENYFEPIVINNQCVIKSSFHTDYPDVQYTITIDPKMAFGTGHHETTSLIIEEILNSDVADKSILDMGCGTGVLAILSAMKSANDIVAVDYDIWSYNNTLENIKLNNTENIKVLHGDVSILNDKKYDVIYANITKNVLLNDIPEYAKRLNPNGRLMLSGFFESDVEDINEVANKCQLKLSKKTTKNKWAMLVYTN